MANQSKLQVEEGSDQTKKKVVYKKRCISLSCTYFAPDGLFGFPKKDGKKDFMRQKWLTVLGLKEEELGKDPRVCVHHFHPSHILERSKSSQRLRLKIGAYPTMNLTKVSLLKMNRNLHPIYVISKSSHQ